MSDYYQVWLLWPQSDANYKCAESDFPEASLSNPNVNAFSHYCDSTGAAKQAQFSKAINRTEWHTYTQQWSPGLRIYSIDGVQIGSTSNNVWAGPERWVLQTETNTTCTLCTQNGNVLIDWAVVYAY